MEKLKIAINIVIALSLVAIAISLVMIATEYTYEKSYRFHVEKLRGASFGNYPTFETCIRDEAALYHRLKEDFSMEDSTCVYRREKAIKLKK